MAFTLSPNCSTSFCGSVPAAQEVSSFHFTACCAAAGSGRSSAASRAGSRNRAWVVVRTSPPSPLVVVIVPARARAPVGIQRGIGLSVPR